MIPAITSRLSASESDSENSNDCNSRLNSPFSIVNQNSWTNLMLAARDDDIRTAQRLILGGATVNDRNGGLTAFIIATWFGSVRVALYLLSLDGDPGVDLNVADDAGNTALLYAVTHQRDRDMIAIEIVNSGRANLNYLDIMGKTALIHSVIHQKVHIAESIVNIKSGIFCLYRDANLNIQDNDGYSAIMHAAKDLQYQLVRLLGDAGADLALTDMQNGYTALDLARAVPMTDAHAGAHREIIAYLVVKESFVAARAASRRNRSCILL